jgi:hypothetical protein
MLPYDGSVVTDYCLQHHWDAKETQLVLLSVPVVTTLSSAPVHLSVLFLRPFGRSLGQFVPCYLFHITRHDHLLVSFDAKQALRLM